jgi:hypothetical protein
MPAQNVRRRHRSLRHDTPPKASMTRTAHPSHSRKARQAADSTDDLGGLRRSLVGKPAVTKKRSITNRRHISHTNGGIKTQMNQDVVRSVSQWLNSRRHHLPSGRGRSLTDPTVLFCEGPSTGG